MRVRTFFGAVVGLDWIDLTRRAVAEKLTGRPGNYAIYSHAAAARRTAYLVVTGR